MLLNMDLTEKYVLPEKYLLQKAATMKIFEYYPLGKELKKQSSVAEKQYQKFGNALNIMKKKKS